MLGGGGGGGFPLPPGGLDNFLCAFPPPPPPRLAPIFFEPNPKVFLFIMTLGPVPPLLEIATIQLLGVVLVDGYTMCTDAPGMVRSIYPPVRLESVPCWLGGGRGMLSHTISPILRRHLRHSLFTTNNLHKL